MSLGTKKHGGGQYGTTLKLKEGEILAKTLYTGSCVLDNECGLAIW